MAVKKIKGLDDFSKKFLLGNTPVPETKLNVSPGWKATPEILQKYSEERQADFVARAGAFTEDLLGFFRQQKALRDLSDIEGIFAAALFTINLRENYGLPQNAEEAKTFTPEKKEEHLHAFDGAAYGAQQYYDANKDDA